LPEPETPIRTTSESSGILISCATGEHRHLRGAADVEAGGSEAGVADGAEFDAIVEARADGGAPGAELSAGPFEAMILVAHAAGGQGFPHHVVFTVGGGDDDGCGFSEFEDDALHGGEARLIHVLDDFAEDGGVEAFGALVPVHKRAVVDLDALTDEG